MSEEEELKESPKGPPRRYSPIPQTPCSRGGNHVGIILEKCLRCGEFLGEDHFLLPQSALPGKKITIKCIECGALREVKPQDAWQVKRCKPCQANKSKKSFAKFMKKVGKHDNKRVGVGKAAAGSGDRGKATPDRAEAEVRRFLATRIG